MRVVLAAIACTAVLGCARPAPPPPVASAADYRKDIEDQLGITRARQRAEACRTGYIPAIGMSEAKVLASCWGAADHATESVSAHGKQAIWSYPEGSLFLTNGVVTRILTSR